eukprot:scaffold92187_cov31-Tisochrysis_lutea.AAC.2
MRMAAQVSPSRAHADWPMEVDGSNRKKPERHTQESIAHKRATHMRKVGLLERGVVAKRSDSDGGANGSVAQPSSASLEVRHGSGRVEDQRVAGQIGSDVGGHQVGDARDN